MIGLLPTVEIRVKLICPTEAQPRKVELVPPAYLDDFALMLRAESRQGSLGDVKVSASTAIEDARSFGLNLYFAEGKTECVAALLVPMVKAAKQRPAECEEGSQADNGCSFYRCPGAVF